MNTGLLHNKRTIKNATIMLTARGLSARGRKCAEYKPVLWLPFLTVDG